MKESEINVAKSQVLAMRAPIPSRVAMLASAIAAVESAKQSVVAAQANHDDAAIQFRRAEPLADKAAISAQELDTRRFELQQADGRRRIAEADLTKADAVAAARADLEKLVTPGSGGDGPDLLVALDKQKQAESALAAAQTELALHCVNSPIKGSVLQVNVGPGEFAWLRRPCKDWWCWAVQDQPICALRSTKPTSHASPAKPKPGRRRGEIRRRGYRLGSLTSSRW